MRHGDRCCIWGRTLFTVAFLCAFAFFSPPLACKACRSSARNLARAIPLKRWFVELIGGVYRMVGRRYCNTVYRTPEGILLSELKKEGELEPIAESVSGFSKWLARKGVPFVYVQTPSKIDMERTMLPAPLVHYGNAMANMFMAILGEKGVRTIDLRAMLTASPKELERYFYRTDHHWNNDAVFNVFGMLAPEIAHAAGDDPAAVAPYVAASSWKRDIWPQCFTGTKSRRTGLLFGGKDDLIVYVPCFKTEMKMDIPSKGIHLSGDFRNVVMSCANMIWKGGTDGFGRDAYSLLYIGGMYGVVQHLNSGAPLKRRVMIVGDSYIRPLEAFLSTVVTDLISLDQRRFEPGETVSGFVESFKPDVVLQICNPAALNEYTVSGHKDRCYVFFSYGDLK